MSIIQCDSICKKFGTFTALDNVSIDVPQGEIFGLLGPNGAGKTTLIRIINRITIPTNGTVLFNGTPMTAEMVREIGYLPEERGLYKKMKVGDQAMYLARLKGLSKAEATVELKKWFMKFKIQSWWNKKIEELSKGMAQKVQFITTVVHKPKLLILDEPFSGFDPINTQIIRNEILRMKDEGTTIMLSTHNMESVEELCDNIALINKSKLVVTGNTDAIRRQYGSNQVEVLYRGTDQLTANPDLFDIYCDEEQKNSRRAVLTVKDGANSKAILTKLVNEVDVASYQELVPRMNDIFIKLVSENK